MPKFFVEKNQINNDMINIIGKDVKHIQRVLRYDIGDELTLCDGEGMDYQCKIIKFLDDKIITQIIDENKAYTEPNVKITIYQGLPKSDKMEYIIQKSVELGVDTIIPVAMKTSVVKIDDSKKEEKKVERWNKIAESAAKQSGRGAVPKVEGVMNFSQAIEHCKDSELKILLYEKEKKLTIHEIFDISNKYKSICVFIGPEGGITEDEIEKAKNANIRIVSLGDRILRTETVSTVILSILMYCMEEI